MTKRILGSTYYIVFLFTLGCGSEGTLIETGKLGVGFTANIKSGQSDVGINTSFEVTVPFAINTETVSTASYFVVKNAMDVVVSASMSRIIDDQCLLNSPLTGSTACSEDKQTCTLTLDDLLEFDTSYLLCVLDKIKLLDASKGNLMSESISFKTTKGYTIGGTITGLNGTIVLQNNEGDDLTITDNGEFSFSTVSTINASYKVTILKNDTNLTCSIFNGSGVINNNHITDIVVTCSSDAFSVGGTLAGLKGTLTLQINQDEELTINEDGSFSFSNEIAKGSPYAIVIKTQPLGYICTVSEGIGPKIESSVSNVVITCEKQLYEVGIMVSGLNGKLVLENNGADELSIVEVMNNEEQLGFVFESLQTIEDAYSITILTQPINQLCTVEDVGGALTETPEGTFIIYAANITCVQNSNHKRFFLSSGVLNGAMKTESKSAISIADELCNKDANKPPGDESLYKALIVDGENRRACLSLPPSGCDISEKIDWVLTPNTIYGQVDGITVVATTNASAIFDFPLNNNIDENKSSSAWTGLDVNWLKHANTCNDWTSLSNSLEGSVGDSSDASSFSISGGTRLCSSTQPLFCVEQ